MRVGSVVVCSVSIYNDVSKGAIGIVLETIRDGYAARVYFPQVLIEWCPANYLNVIEVE